MVGKTLYRGDDWFLHLEVDRFTKPSFKRIYNNPRDWILKIKN